MKYVLGPVTIDTEDPLIRRDILVDTSGDIELPVEWDILATASDVCLDGYLPGFIEKEVIKQLPAGIVYRIYQKQLGDLGTIQISQLRPGWSKISISGVPMDSIDTAPAWLDVKPKWEKKWQEALNENRTKKKAVSAYVAVTEEMDRAEEEIVIMQKAHQAKVIGIYFEHLEQKNIFPVTDAGVEITKPPEEPERPKVGSSIDVWLDYYHAMKNAGYKMTFPMLYKLSGHSNNTFKKRHGPYKRNRGLMP